MFRRIFYALLAHFGQQAVWQRTRFRFKMPIKLLDSSTITLTMSLYEWAHYTIKKGAVKMHTLLDDDSLLPEFVNITDGKCGDNRGALHIPVPPHSVVVADCGYCDFSLFDYWDSRNVFLMSGTGTTCFTHKLKNVYCPKRERKMCSSTRLLS